MHECRREGVRVVDGDNLGFRAIQYAPALIVAGPEGRPVNVHPEALLSAATIA